ncbi:tetratricopeptide repeat-containing sensor histidine kinase [Pedobacter boryungensis]|uniref:histidine kinase n=1 Tax=Pedobacter boryungensis TaxID=869962 RepID=A0ABX2DGC0_9SPHI|nr:tetratricopeptide repeat-containing sensor histidine kinase [Pedobacter boryungensis]NQX33152.1 tetratricopeptide repeat protein [Pedobacter boryungensis]
MSSSRSPVFVLLLFLFLPSFCFGQTRVIDSLKKVIQSSGTTKEICAAHNKLATEFTRYDLNQAKEHLHIAFSIAKSINWDLHVAYSYTEFVNIFRNTAMTDSAEYYLEKLKQLSLQHGSNSSDDIKIRSNYNSVKGLMLKNEGNYKAAIPYLLQAFKESEILKNPISAAGQLLNIGNTYLKLGAYETALNYHLKALDGFLKINNKKGQSFCYQAIAGDFVALQIYDKALDYAMKSRRIKALLNDKRGICSSNTSLGLIYRGLKAYEKSLKYFQIALHIAREMQLFSEEYEALMELGNTYLEMNEPLKALNEFKLVLRLAVKSGDEIKIKAIEAKLKFLQPTLVSDIGWEKKLFDNIHLYAKDGNKEQELESYKYLVKFYQDKNDFKKAFFYNEQFHTKKDSLLNYKLAMQLKKKEEVFNLERREKEITLLKRDRLINLAALEKQRVVKYSLVFFSFLMAFVLLLTVYRRNTILKANAVLALEDMRISIARDLHDDIGSRLTNIQLMTELIRNPNIIKNPQKDYILAIREEIMASTEALDEIVWNMNGKAAIDVNLQVRMRRYAGEIFDMGKIDYQMNMSDELIDKQFSHEKQRDIFLMFREILNNIRKHAEASKVLIELKTNRHHICLNISDDGKGFDLANLETERNGLKNIKSRTEKWKGKLVLASMPGVGTQFTITIPKDGSTLKQLLVYIQNLMSKIKWNKN